MKFVLLLFVVFAFSGIVTADYTVNYGWESTETILGNYGDIIATIATSPVHSGSQSLCLEDDAASGTPQAFVAWVTGLQAGDEVTGKFWRNDTTPGTSPSCRIWGHWNHDQNDINVYSGTASGQSDYGPGLGWDETSYVWTADTLTSLVIECRTYSSPGDVVWIDDMTIIAPDHATIYTPNNVALENRTWADIKAAF